MRQFIQSIIVITVLVLSFFFLSIYTGAVSANAAGSCQNISSADGGFQYFFKCEYERTPEASRPALVKSWTDQVCGTGPNSSVPQGDKDAACNYLRLGLYELDTNDAFIQSNPIDILRLAISLLIGGIMIFVTFKIILLGYEIANLNGESDKLSDKLKKLGYYLLGLVLALVSGSLVTLLPNLLGASEVTNILQACDQLERNGYGASIVARCREIQEANP